MAVSDTLLHATTSSPKCPVIECPICHRNVTIKVRRELLKRTSHYPLTHVIVHRNPPHALMVYVDANGSIRGVEQCESVQHDDR